MKIKKGAYLQSPTALLRPLNLKISSDFNDQCQPWFITVPSITYIWTHRPQWRRRHKNRKKAKAFPLKFMNSERKERDLLKHHHHHQERPCSRCSTSPYETCSSRQIIVTESLSTRNSGERKEILTSNQSNRLYDRRGIIFGTHSDSGLRNPKGTKFPRLIRSQKRLGVRNSANSQNTLGTLSSLDVNRSVQLFLWMGLQSDCSIPKRRVTFSNYVSEKNSAIDNRSQISATTMNDNNDTSEASWWQKSYVRLTDDDDHDDNCSIQTDLSCLISSIIFDESKSSFFSFTDAGNSGIRRRSIMNLNREFSESLVYINSAYSNGSSCNILSISENFFDDDFKQSNGCSLIDENLNNGEEFGRKKIKDDLRISNEVISGFQVAEEIDSQVVYSRDPRNCAFGQKTLRGNINESNCIVSGFEISEEIKIDGMYSSTPHTVDFMNKNLRENSSESNNFVHVFKIPEEIIIQPSYSSTLRKFDSMNKKLSENLSDSNDMISDIKITEEIKTDPPYSSIECITIELKDVSSTLKEISIESRNESDKEELYSSMRKNHISTDTSDLIILNLIPSLDPMSQLLKNQDNGLLTVTEILNLLQQPTNSLDSSFFLEKFNNLEGKDFDNYDAINKFNNIGRKKSEDIKKIEDQVELLRIDTESCGEYESIFIEINDFDEEFKNNEIFEKKSSLKIRNFQQEACKSLAVHLNGINEHSEHGKCSDGGKCCLICGRKSMDNPRYIRPVCRVKGENSTPRLENDPWLNVMKKVVKPNNRQEFIHQEAPKTQKNEGPLKDEQKLSKESSKNSVSKENSTNEIPKEKEYENIEKKEEKEEESLSVIITDVENPSSSISPDKTNEILPSRADQSTSCCPPELRSSTSFGFATFRGPRTHLSKTYFMRESVRTVEGTANRLLCVISESSNSLMAVPPFLPKKPPDWFARQMPTRRWSRR